MSRILTTDILSQGFVIYMTILVLMPMGGLSKRGGILNFQFLCYENPGQLDFTGTACDSFPSSNCDPYFRICISNQLIKSLSESNCPVLLYVSKPYDNKGSVCNKPKDIRGDLQSFKDIDLPYPLQELYYVRIEVVDRNQWSNDKVIAVFSSTVHSNPTPNLRDFKHEELFMVRMENRIKNPNVRMRISVAFKCDSDLYGEQCATFCRSSESDHFVCSEKGMKICKSGWIGPDCIVKDPCKDFRCAKGAFCLLINNLPKCTCHGIIGSECYPNYNPCRPNPCKNNGTCVREQGLSGGISCICKRFYHGSRCLQEFNLCDIEPCQNNGTCVVSENGTRTCKCTSRFKGAVCDSPNIPQISPRSIVKVLNTSGASRSKTEKINSVVIIFSALSFLCLSVALAVFYVRCVGFRNKGKSVVNKKEIEMKGISLPSPNIDNSNEYGTYKEETLYDTIDDRATYIYQLETNDGYLVPSKPNSPVISASIATDSSDYIQMFSNDDLYSAEAAINIPGIEDEIPPALPSRKHMKRHFLLMCIKKK